MASDPPSLAHRTGLRRSPHLPAAVIVAVGFLARLAWMLHVRPMPVSDFNDYRTLALGIIDHLQFGYPEPTAFFLPVHPTFLAGFALISRSDLWLAFSMVLVGTASVLLVYLVGLRVLPTRRAALIAAGIFALFPTFVVFSPVLATEHLFVLLMLGAIYLLTGEPSSRRFAASGVLLGLAVVTRGEAVFYLPAVGLWGLIGMRSALPLKRRVQLLAVAAAAVLVVVIPWYVRNAVVVGPEAGLSASAGLNFYFAHNDSGNYGDYTEGNPLVGLPSEQQSALGWKLGWQHIKAHPLNLVKDIRIGTLRLFGAPDYAVIWATSKGDFYGDPEFEAIPVRFSTALNDLARITTAALVTLSLAALLVPRSWQPGFSWLIVPLCVSSWMLRTVIYWAMPRYAYFITSMFVFAAALTIDRLLAAGMLGSAKLAPKPA